LLFFNQTPAVSFPNSKQLFFLLAFFQQDSQKKLPGHKKTQHNTLQFPGHKTSKFGSKNRKKFHREKKNLLIKKRKRN
jgi:hypothetical protein